MVFSDLHFNSINYKSDHSVVNQLTYEEDGETFSNIYSFSIRGNHQWALSNR